MGRGVSIHREDCEQLKELSRRNPERLIDAVWGENYSGGYGLTIRIISNDRPACCAISPQCWPTRRSM